MKKSLRVIGSKSYSHRVLFLNALTGNKGQIININEGDDVKTTSSILSSIDYSKNEIIIDVHDSATTLRMLMPYLSAKFEKVTFKLGPSLMKRSFIEVENFYKRYNVDFLHNGDHIIVNRFCFKDEMIFDFSYSSQFLSGLIIASAFLNKDKTVINLVGKQVSFSYINITQDVLNHYGIKINISNNRIVVYPFEKLQMDFDYEIEGDWSSAANFILYGLNKEDVLLNNMSFDSYQGDRNLLSIIPSNLYEFINGDLLIHKGLIEGFNFDLENNIDLGPVIIGMAMFAKSECHIYSIKRLRNKESNRLLLMEKLMNHLNVAYEEKENELIVKPSKIIYDNKVVDTGNDHRIIMICKILQKLGYELVLNFEDGIVKSDPGFNERLG